MSKSRIIRATSAAAGAGIGMIGGPLPVIAGAILASEGPDILSDLTGRRPRYTKRKLIIDIKLHQMLDRDLARSPFADRHGVQPTLQQAFLEWNAANGAMKTAFRVGDWFDPFSFAPLRDGGALNPAATRLVSLGGPITVECTAAASGVVAATRYLEKYLGIPIVLGATGQSSKHQVYHALTITEPDIIIATLGSMALSTASSKSKYNAVLPLYFGLQAEVADCRYLAYTKAIQPVVYCASGAEEHALISYGKASNASAMLLETSQEVISNITQLERGQRAILWEPVLWRTAGSRTHQIVPSSILRSWQGIFVHRRWSRTIESRRVMRAFCHLFASAYGLLSDNLELAIECIDQEAEYQKVFNLAL